MTDESTREIKIEESTTESAGSSAGSLCVVLFLITTICIGVFYFIHKNKENTATGHGEAYIQEGIEFMTKELKTLQIGDFVELNDGTLLIVTSNPPRNQFIYLTKPFSEPQQFMTETVAKNTKQIIRSDDDSWPAMAKRFLVPYKQPAVADRLVP